MATTIQPSSSSSTTNQPQQQKNKKQQRPSPFGLIRPATTTTTAASTKPNKLGVSSVPISKKNKNKQKKPTGNATSKHHRATHVANSNSRVVWGAGGIAIAVSGDFDQQAARFIDDMLASQATKRLTQPNKLKGSKAPEVSGDMLIAEALPPRYRIAPKTIHAWHIASSTIVLTPAIVMGCSSRVGIGAAAIAAEAAARARTTAPTALQRAIDRQQHQQQLQQQQEQSASRGSRTDDDDEDDESASAAKSKAAAARETKHLACKFLPLLVRPPSAPVVEADNDDDEHGDNESNINVDRTEVEADGSSSSNEPPSTGSAPAQPVSSTAAKNKKKHKKKSVKRQQWF